MIGTAAVRFKLTGWRMKSGSVSTDVAWDTFAPVCKVASWLWGTRLRWRNVIAVPGATDR